MKALPAFPTRLRQSMRDRASAFLHDEAGAISVEAAIWLPIMGFLYVASVQYFHAYRQETLMTKASYMVGDLLSREEGSVTAVDFEGLQDVFEFVTGTEGRSNLRFSEIRRNGDQLNVVWSYATDGGTELTDTRLQAFLDKVPTLVDNERVIIVETYAVYETAFNVGLGDRVMEQFVPTRSRYTARLDYDATVPAPTTVVTTSTGGDGTDDGTDPANTDDEPKGVWINGMYIPLP